MRRWTILSWVAVGLICGGMTGPTVAAPDYSKFEKQLENRPFVLIASEPVLSTWMSNYYRMPGTVDVPGMLQIMAAAIAKNPKDNVMPVTGFLSGLFDSSPEQVDIWLESWDRLPADQQKILGFALAKSHSAASKTAYQKIGEDQLRALGLQLPIPDPDTQPIKFAYDLDFYWGRFFATGAREPLERIVSKVSPANDQACWPDDKACTVYAPLPRIIAKWALTSNAQQHEVIRKHAENILRTASDPHIVEVLRGIIETSEKNPAKTPNP